MKAHLNNILKRYDNSRLLAVDVLRGLTITAMILVNNPGSWEYVYAPLRHAKWHGWTPTDLIFPFFILLVGWSIYASKVAKEQHHPHNSNNNTVILKQGLIRTLKLFGLGLFLAVFYYNFTDPLFSWLQDRLYTIRIMGVLQRIALVYIITLVLVLYCRAFVQYFVAIGIALIYVIGLYFVPYSDPSGQILQGNLQQGLSLADYIDVHILGAEHMYLSELKPFASDPEGLFSTLPAIITCLSGVWLARWMHKREVGVLYCIKMFCAGMLIAASGHYLSSLIPINKPLWTPSYVLLSSGLAISLLALLVYILDIRKARNWFAPFVVFGTNAIAFFMFAGVFARILIMIPVADSTLKKWLYQHLFQPVFGNYFGSFCFALAFLVVSYLVMYVLYRRQIFWKV